MRISSLSAPSPNLEAFVVSLLEEWRPDCLCHTSATDSDYDSDPSTPPTLHDLFDISPGSSPDFTYNPETDEVFVASPDSPAFDYSEPEGSDLETPPVSPLRYPGYDPTLPDEMLMCLEEMPTFDEDDEVRSEGSAFETWRTGLEPGSSVGCLRCAYYQEKGESSLCGLCYLKALSEGMLFFTYCILEFYRGKMYLL